jgi:T5SS/PEP-CTERM-associated repeat protein
METIMPTRSRYILLLLPLLLSALLLSGLVAYGKAAGGNFPAWSFKPVASALPPGVQDPVVREIGEQGELVVEYLTNTVKSYGVASGGMLTHIFSVGDQAPGGGSFVDLGLFEAYAATPTLVYLSTYVNDGSQDVLRHYRWSNGALTHLATQPGEVYDVRTNDAHGKFISRRNISEEDTEFRITDGVTFSDPITLHDDGINDNPNTSQALIGITADGAFLIRELTYSGTIGCTLRSNLPNEQTFSTRLFWLGSRNGDVVSGSGTSNGCGGSGTNIETPAMNSAGDILSREYSFVIDPSGVGQTLLTTLRLYPGDGSASSVIAQGEQVNNVGPYFFMQPLAITEWRQPIFVAADSPANFSRLYTGPNPTLDIFDGDFFNGFGQDGIAYNMYLFSEKGGALVGAILADNSFVYALGRAVTAVQWIDPAGGSWGDAGNWDSGEVPGSTSETLFNLDAAYTVTVGTHDVGRVRLEDGFVTFKDANLTLLGPLTVGNDATFDMTSGTLDTSELVIGSLPPSDILNPPTAHVQISNQGTTITGTAVISISHASPGSLFLDDATIHGGPLIIGEHFPGSATLSGQHAKWYTNGAMAVGYNYTGTLSIENGAFLRNAGQVVIGQGTSLQAYTSQVQVQNLNAPQPDYGNWLLLDTLSIGNFLRGELHISHGGRLTLFSDTGIMQAGLRSHPGPGFDAFISVDGSSDSATITSTLEAFNDVMLGMANEALVGVNVNGGGQFTVDGADLFLGFLAGSEATMTVAGVNTHGSPALVQVKRPVGSFVSGVCAIGEGGVGRLLIHSGGQAECGTIRIGGQPGSSGFVSVDGAHGSSTLTTEGGLCIGGDFIGLCGAAETGLQGTLELKNSASVSAGRGTLVGPGGKITGSGDISVGLLGFDVAPGGVIDPGVTILAPQARPSLARLLAGAPATVAAIQTGAITINGSLTISPTAQVTLDVLGLNNHDQLNVNGDITLAGGTLTLAFNNGHAPKQGDVYQFLVANSVSGNFSNVQITGLEPGFQYELNVVNGAVELKALNDGVAATPEPLYPVYLPLALR